MGEKIENERRLRKKEMEHFRKLKTCDYFDTLSVELKP